MKLLRTIKEKVEDKIRTELEERQRSKEIYNREYKVQREKALVQKAKDKAIEDANKGSYMDRLKEYKKRKKEQGQTLI